MPVDAMDIRGAIIARCTSYDNGANGIMAETRSSVLDCTVTDNFGVGIESDNGITVDRCTAGGNDIGIKIGYRSVVRDCVVELNGKHGIWCEYSYNSIIGNDVHMNGANDAGGGSAKGVGILLGEYSPALQGSDNRVQGNHVTQNDEGIVIRNKLSARNIIVQNTTTNNRDSTIACPTLNDFRQYGFSSADGLSTIFYHPTTMPLTTPGLIKANMIGNVISLTNSSGLVLNSSNAWANLDISLPCQ